VQFKISAIHLTKLTPSDQLHPMDFDIVLFGATGFTGRLVAEALTHAAPASLRLALAGRSKTKLQEIQNALPNTGQRFQLETVDATDEAALLKLAQRTKVICTTVGPYAKYGLGVVKACATAGTHYCDITGEVQFMRDSIDGFDALAKKTGARVVHTCGFDSIPSDMGVLFLSHHLQTQGQSGQLLDTVLSVERAKGKFSGGTIASLVNVLDEAKTSAARRTLLRDPYALSPDRDAEPDLGPQRGLATARFDEQLGRWTAPFVMEAINARVVRRSNALSNYAYGRQFKYREVTATGTGPTGAARSVALTLGMGALMGGLQSSFTRGFVDKLLPKPGEGPTEAERKAGFFHLRVVAQTAEHTNAEVWVKGVGDPGYDATSRMMAQAALALASDEGTAARGVLTPATAFGVEFVKRLEAVQVRFTVSPR
jgi:short subunit dehydrogenase-like uncharacterized protein